MKKISITRQKKNVKKKHFQSNEMPIFDDDGGHHHQWELYSS